MRPSTPGRLLITLLCACLSSPGIVFAEDKPRKQAPLPPAESLKQLKVPADLQLELVLAEPLISQPVFLNFDERGRMWVVEYRQYPQPAGLKVVSHDSVWRAVYDKIPEPPPRGAPGKDRISIHEDSDGDGVYDKHTVFIDGLNIATAVERGRGGVWVLNPPYLLFYADKNSDDVPDGPPEVRLEGFGLEDTHSVINSLRWGPDGWLYAAQGSTVTAQIRRPGDKSAVNSLGQLIWRYHPETRRYEIFAEGGGNTFGVELDDKGRIFSGHNGGDTRGFHYVQGGYSRKGFDKHGPLSNPYTFGYFPQMTNEQKVPRFTHTFLKYEGGALPERYRGKLLAADPLRNTVFETEMIPDGSTFRTKDVGEAIASSDRWFRPVDVKLGPDGAVYIADWYDKEIGHFRMYESTLDQSGRIYRLKTKGAAATHFVELGKKTSHELLEMLRSENRWARQAALRLLGDRRDTTVIPTLVAALEKTEGQLALEYLWALNLSGGFADAVALRTLAHTDPFVRAWTARLLCDERGVSPTIAAALADAARRETNAETRNQIAASARRLPAVDALPIIRSLIGHDEDVNDPHIPLLIWWAIEVRCGAEHSVLLEFMADKTMWQRPLVKEHILERLMRRWASVGDRVELLACAKLLDMSPDKDCSQRLMSGFEKAFEGRAIPPLPTELMEAMAKAGGDSLMLDLRLGKADAASRALAVIADEKTKAAKRVPLIQIFGEINHPESVPVLLKLATSKGDAALRKAALTALQQYGDSTIAETLLKHLKEFSSDIRAVAMGVLITRPAWALPLLKEVQGGSIARESVPREIVESLQRHDDPAVTSVVEKLWPKPKRITAAELDDELRAEISRVSKIAAGGGGTPKLGAAIFAQRCGVCHTLFGQGGQVGPDLTVFKRDDLDTVLLSIVVPSGEIREGFENVMIKTKDGRRLNGIIKDQDKQIVVLRGADGQDTTLQRSQIEQTKPAGISLMPEGALSGLNDEELKNLFAFLRSSQPPK